MSRTVAALRFGADNRWQGYTHRQLYEMLHSGPGSGAAGSVADQWSGMADALSDIQQEISTGVTGSGASWAGAAGDTARDALGPLGEWAQQAATAADVMRISTDLQGDLLAKARADMPAPVAVPQQPSQIGQLVTAQVDYEVQELSSQLAAQQAYQVMAQYEAATNDNTSTLGDFGEPPMLEVDTTPITGPAVRTTVRSTDPVHGTTRPRTTAGRTQRESTPRGVDSEESRSTTKATPESAEVPESSPSTTDSTTTPAPPESTAPPSTDPGVSATVGGEAATPTPRPTNTVTPQGVEPEPTAPQSTVPRSTAAPTTTPSAVPNTTPTGTSAAQNRKSSNDTDHTSTGGLNAQSSAAGRFTGAVVPSARRSDDEDEREDQIHESKYLIEADDIYGRQTYAPPVIGESPRRR